MAQNTDTSVRQGADGKLEIQQNNIIEALVGSNDSDYASVGIVDLQAALTSTIKQGYKIENTYQSVTGKTLDLSNANAIRQARMDFRDALEIHMALMKASGVQGAGLNAVLEGKGRQYIDAVKNRLTQ